mmetsp:Transcript_16302/g.26053  ORF Transcript_16302/g.26053 Transcript_16302/m.26053 type:complete len:156 (-) Transcript_16302:2-469(-)
MPMMSCSSSQLACWHPPSDASDAIDKLLSLPTVDAFDKLLFPLPPKCFTCKFEIVESSSISLAPTFALLLPPLVMLLLLLSFTTKSSPHASDLQSNALLVARPALSDLSGTTWEKPATLCTLAAQPMIVGRSRRQEQKKPSKNKKPTSQRWLVPK